MRPYLQLLRPANVVTALADILAGWAIVRGQTPGLTTLPWLLLATAGLYAGGVTLNDVFDRRLDAVERPERPIPSGRVPARHAALLGAVLLGVGIAAAWQAGPASGLVAAALAAFVLFYDALAKRSAAAGPPTMGACRGLNLILGMSAAPGAFVAKAAWLGLVPFIYIWSVTAVSRHEVSRGSARAAGAGLMGVILAVGAVMGLAVAHPVRPEVRVVATLLTLALGARVVPPFWRAWRSRRPEAAREAVRAGVLSLVLLDGCLAAICAGPAWGLGIVALSAVAYALARLFAVT